MALLEVLDPRQAEYIKKGKVEIAELLEGSSPISGNPRIEHIEVDRSTKTAERLELIEREQNYE